MGRKGREVIRLGPVPWEGNSEEKGSYMGRNPPWVVSGLSHILGTPTLGSYKGKTSPLGWTEGWWDCQEGYRKSGLHL